MPLLGHVTSNEMFYMGALFGLGVAFGLLLAYKLGVWFISRR